MSKEKVEYRGKIKSYSEIRGLEEFLKAIEFDEEKYRVVKSREEVYGSPDNPCYLCDVTYVPIVKNVDEIPKVLEAFREEVKNITSNVVWPEPKNVNEGKTLVEICLFDHHFGQLSWKPEVGDNYDIKIAKKIALDAVDDLISQIGYRHVDKFLLPIGNDFFNVNSQNNTTLAGTPQAEDCRWQKTFTEGLRLIIEIVNRLSGIAPVDLMVVVGNHDTERSFYMGEALWCFYASNENVNVENSPKVRKYYRWGKVALGFTHGKERDRNKLPLLMATEEPKMFSETKYREFHIGHLHFRRNYGYEIDEENSVTIRVMPSLVATDDYHFAQGYSHLRRSLAIVWDSNKGQRAEYCYTL